MEPVGDVLPETGVVKWFDCKKGFGFVVDQQGRDVFVHYRVIEGEGHRRLYDGERVAYLARETQAGLRAVKVRQIEPRPRKSRTIAEPGEEKR